MSEEQTYNNKVKELLGLTKNKFATPAISYDEKSNELRFTDIKGNPIKASDYVTFVKGVDEKGNFIPAERQPRPMTVMEYIDYQSQSFSSAQIYVKGYVDRTFELIGEKRAELKSAEAELAKYEQWKEASKDNRSDLHHNKQKVKDADAKRNGILESSLPIPSAEQLKEMLELAERSDNLIDTIRLRKTDLRNWDNLSQEVKDYYIALNGDFSTKEGREEGIKTAAAQITNYMSATQDKLEELEGKAPLVVLSDEEFNDRTVGFVAESALKIATSVSAFALGCKAGNKVGAGTKDNLTSVLEISPLVKLPLPTRIGISGTGFVADAAVGFGVEWAAAKLYDAARLEPQMNMIIESGALTEETAKLVQERMTADSQVSSGPLVGGLEVVAGLDGFGVKIPILGPIKIADISKVSAIYFGDIEMSGEYIPSKGTNFGQFDARVEVDKDVAVSQDARNSQLDKINKTLDTRFEEYKTERENKRQEPKSPLEIAKADNALAAKNKGEENVR